MSQLKSVIRLEPGSHTAYAICFIFEGLSPLGCDTVLVALHSLCFEV